MSEDHGVRQTINAVGFWPPWSTLGKGLKDFKGETIHLDLHFRKPRGATVQTKDQSEAMGLGVQRLLKFFWRAGNDSLSHNLMGLSTRQISGASNRSAAPVRHLGQ